MYVLLLYYLEITLEVDGTETKPQTQQPLQKVISKDTDKQTSGSDLQAIEKSNVHIYSLFSIAMDLRPNIHLILGSLRPF